jgi:hypothetical protein
MRECSEIRTELLDLLQGRLSRRDRALVEAHLGRCPSCADELRALEGVWNALSGPPGARPPRAARLAVLAYAREALGGRESAFAALWQAVRGFAVPAALGAAAAGVLVLALHVRGAMASLGHLTVVGVSLTLAGVLAVIAGGLLRSSAPRTARTVLLGAVGALGGYVVLSLISPIPDSVRLCQVTFFGGSSMSMGELCLVYLAVAVLYAGVPMAAAAFAWGSSDDRWRTGLAEAGVFALLASLSAFLQLGLEEWIITLTALTGVLVGSLAGGLAGVWMRTRRVLRAAASVLVAGVALAALAAPAPLQAQALPFHTETAITTGFEEGAARTFVSFFGRGGLVRGGTSVSDPLQRDIDVFAVPVGVLPYAITPMWTTRVIVPFVRKSMEFVTPEGERGHYVTSGVGDVVVDTKWVFFARNRLGGTTRLGVGGGVKIPIGGTDARLPDGSVAPRPLQVGTGSWDFPFKALLTVTERHVGLLTNVGYRVKTAADGFKAGNVFTYDVAVALRFLPWTYRSLTDQSLVAYLELNGTVSAKDEVNGAPNPDSGGHVLFLSPDLQWIPTPWLLFEASAQFPVLQDLNGSQLEYDSRFQLGTRVRFSVFR